MPSQPDLIALFVTPLERTGIEYVITGAVAAIVYGEPRLTNDIDIVVALHADQVRPLLEAFHASQFYVPPTEAVLNEIARDRHGHFNIIHNETSLKADFYPAGSDELHAWAFAHKLRVMLPVGPVMVAPPEYVVIRKLEYYRAGGSDKHVRDIRAMLRIPENRIDHSFIEQEVDRLGLETEWQAVTT